MADLRHVIERLEASGYRVTGPRLALLAVVGGMPGQFSAEEVQQRLPRVGRATVFRTLKLLVELGVVCRILRDDGRLFYRWGRGGHHHHHLLCTTCGATRDLSECGVPELLDAAIRASGFALERHWLEVYGRCRRCQEEEGQRQATARGGPLAAAVRERRG